MIVLILLAGVIGALLAVEIAARLALGMPLLRRRPTDQDAVNHPFVHGRRTVAFHRTLGWTTWPDLRFRGAREISTDEYGNRLPSTAARALPVGGFLACGDSFAFGSEVDDHQSWPALLEARLGTPVVNAAAGGYGYDQVVLRIEEMVGLCKPSTVIVGSHWHGILRNELKTYNHVHKPYFTIESGALRLHNCPVPLFSHEFAAPGTMRTALEHSYVAFRIAQALGVVRKTKPGEEPYEVATPPGTGIAITCLLIDRLKAHAARNGYRLVFLMQYGSNDFDQEAAPDQARQVLDHARAAGIETVDPWPELRELFVRDPAGFRTLWVVQADGVTLGHMSEAGNRFTCERLVAGLQSALAAANQGDAPYGRRAG